MDKKVAQHDILWMATDDWTGLWEVAWSLQTLWPELRGEPAEQKGRALLSELLDDGLIYLCFFGEGNKEKRVSRQKAHELLNDPENWEPPEGFIEHVRFAATEEGERRMFALEREVKAKS